MDIGSLVFSGAALVVSLLSFYFSIKSWRESNRPIVTARVSTKSGGNVGSSLILVVHNTGTRPAKNVTLSADLKELEAAMIPTINPIAKRFIEQIFNERGVIPILENGRSASNDFGFLRKGVDQLDWKRLSRINVVVSYQELDGRKYEHTNPLLIADDRGFAGSWSESSREQSDYNTAVLTSTFNRPRNWLPSIIHLEVISIRAGVR